MSYSSLFDVWTEPKPVRHASSLLQPRPAPAKPSRLAILAGPSSASPAPGVVTRINAAPFSPAVASTSSSSASLPFPASQPVVRPAPPSIPSEVSGDIRALPAVPAHIPSVYSLHASSAPPTANGSSSSISGSSNDNLLTPPTSRSPTPPVASLPALDKEAENVVFCGLQDKDQPETFRHLRGIGRAFVKSVLLSELYQRMPDATSKDCETKAAKAFVDRSFLAGVAEELDLPERICSLSASRQVPSPKILAETFQAFVGALLSSKANNISDVHAFCSKAVKNKLDVLASGGTAAPSKAELEKTTPTQVDVMQPDVETTLSMQVDLVAPIVETSFPVVPSAANEPGVVAEETNDDDLLMVSEVELSVSFTAAPPMEVDLRASRGTLEPLTGPNGQEASRRQSTAHTYPAHKIAHPTKTAQEALKPAQHLAAREKLNVAPSIIPAPQDVSVQTHPTPAEEGEIPNAFPNSTAPYRAPDSGWASRTRHGVQATARDWIPARQAPYHRPAIPVNQRYPAPARNLRQTGPRPKVVRKRPGPPLAGMQNNGLTPDELRVRDGLRPLGSKENTPASAQNQQVGSTTITTTQVSGSTRRALARAQRVNEPTATGEQNSPAPSGRGTKRKADEAGTPERKVLKKQRKAIETLSGDKLKLDNFMRRHYPAVDVKYNPSGILKPCRPGDGRRIIDLDLQIGAPFKFEVIGSGETKAAAEENAAGKALARLIELRDN